MRTLVNRASASCARPSRRAPSAALHAASSATIAFTRVDERQPGSKCYSRMWRNALRAGVDFERRPKIVHKVTRRRHRPPIRLVLDQAGKRSPHVGGESSVADRAPRPQQTMSGDAEGRPQRRGSGFLAAAVDWICKCVAHTPRLLLRCTQARRSVVGELPPHWARLPVPTSRRRAGRPAGPTLSGNVRPGPRAGSSPSEWSAAGGVSRPRQPSSNY